MSPGKHPRRRQFLRLAHLLVTSSRARFGSGRTAVLLRDLVRGCAGTAAPPLQTDHVHNLYLNCTLFSSLLGKRPSGKMCAVLNIAPASVYLRDVGWSVEGAGDRHRQEGLWLASGREPTAPTWRRPRGQPGAHCPAGDERGGVRSRGSLQRPGRWETQDGGPHPPSSRHV